MHTNTSKLILLLLLGVVLALTFPAAKGDSVNDPETMPTTRFAGSGILVAATIPPAQIQGLSDYRPLRGQDGTFCTTRIINGKTMLFVGVQKINPFNAKRPLGGEFPPVEIEFSTGEKITVSANKCRATNRCFYKPVSFPAGCFSSDCGFTLKVDPRNDIREADERNNVAQGVCVG